MMESKTPHTRRCAIIGAGVSGIAASVRMRQKGFSVDVFEANPFPGGKLSSESIRGYRFDMGPSVFTMPEYVDELFRLCGKDPAKHFQYIPLDPVYRYFFEDGSRLDAYHGQEEFARVMAANSRDSRADILAHLRRNETAYLLTEPVFLQQSLHRLRNFFNWPTLRGILNLGRIGAFSTMHRANTKAFGDPRLRQIFDRYATYNGSSPFLSPATLNVISHVEIVRGAYYPVGGMYSITQSLAALAQDIGVRFHFSEPVREILVENQQVKAVRTDKREFPCDVVISNMDIYNCYKKLLPHAKKPTRTLEQPKSSSGVIFYWGIRKSFPELLLHNIFFSRDYEEEFNCIFQQKIISQDPSVYVNITSKHTPADAPPGCENWFTFINVPNNSGQDWDRLVAGARASILRKLNRLLHMDIEPFIEAELVFDPRVIETRTSSAFGAIYGNSSNNKFAAFLRHANFSREIRNLYFCGGSVHPGPSIPLCLLSAKITVDLVK